MEGQEEEVFPEGGNVHCLKHLLEVQVTSTNIEMKPCDTAVWKVLVILTGAGVEGAGIQFMCFSRSGER